MKFLNVPTDVLTSYSVTGNTDFAISLREEAELKHIIERKATDLGCANPKFSSGRPPGPSDLPSYFCHNLQPPVIPLLAHILSREGQI